MRFSSAGVAWPTGKVVAMVAPPGTAVNTDRSRRAACPICMHGQVHEPCAQQSLSQSAGCWVADGGSSTGAERVAPSSVAWSHALASCGEASAIDMATCAGPSSMAGIDTAAMALPIPLRSRHRAKSRRRVMRDMVTGYDRARACHVKKTFKTTRPSGKASKSLAGMPTAGHIPCNLGLGSCSKCSEELPWRRTPAMSSAIARIPKS